MCILINIEEKVLIHNRTGKIKRITCFDTLALVHSYLRDRGHDKQANQLLDDAFKGKKVITELIKTAGINTSK
jgi:hypothetical protein